MTVDLPAPCAAGRSTVNVTEFLSRVAVGPVDDERVVVPVIEPPDLVIERPVSVLMAADGVPSLPDCVTRAPGLRLPSTPFPSKKDVDLSPKVPV